LDLRLRRDVGARRREKSPDAGFLDFRKGAHHYG
jgi:hypothetical protein